MKVGVISDTHGLLRPEAVSGLRGVKHILHAGDVGNPAILGQLREIAPLTAIRGNIDSGGVCARLPAVELIELNGVSIYMLHDVHELDLEPVAVGIQVVISGHSHKPLIAWKKGVLYFNPGSAGPRRFSLPVSIGFLEISNDEVQPQLMTIG
ncbi:metallophosphoesterase family protein [Acidobacterium sp. S8]|uniref:metallophosphoesterase family protein n=1 Tax=Acidobacterium sp. S8 TaxID=1641854 RepID=UPI00131E9FBD|nr:metallophosphoesterase family protein [Acidobacterium sp. S8]